MVQILMNFLPGGQTVFPPHYLTFVPGRCLMRTQIHLLERNVKIQVNTQDQKKLLIKAI